MKAYYNEFDTFAAAWLRELIKAGHIAPGEVDERSIEDVHPDDLKEFTQCHFFAGVGVWSYALRRAGWPDDRPVWTGSCPCQPFSAAGKGGGVNDERHLWPAWYHLITQRRPSVVFGEQVASKAGLGWLDLVQTDMEGAGHAFGAVDLCVAGVGAPHIRQRLWFVAERMGDTKSQRRGEARTGCGRSAQWTGDASESGRMADAESERRDRSEDSARQTRRFSSENGCNIGRMADTELQQRQIAQAGSDDAGGRLEEPTAATGLCGDSGSGFDSTRLRVRGSVDTPIAGSTMPGVPGDRERECDIFRPGPTNGIWRDADWLYCRDGKWRPVEPGTFPLAHGAPARVGRLRGYGNAINAVVAQTFIEAYLGEET